MANVHQNSQHMRVMNLKYKSKYKKIKKQIKNLVFENAALCDEVVEVQAELAIARDERKFLIKRLMRHEGLEAIERAEQQQQREQNSQTKDDQQQMANKIGNVPKKRGPKKRIQNDLVEKTKEKLGQKSCDKTGNSNKMFPMNLYNLLVHSPGEIIPINPNFHNANCIYPVGYVSTRIYAHPKDPQRKTVYTCKILNNAGAPQFQIIPDNDLESVFFGESANICHKALLETLQRSLSNVVKLPLHVQGEKFFGLTHPTVKNLIRSDPGFTHCSKFKEFSSGPQEDIPDDKDPTMCFEALQSLISLSANHTIEELKEEPPDELLNFS